MSTHPPGREPADETALIDLVAAGLAELRAGRAPDLAALCVHRPDLRATVAEALSISRGLPELAEDAFDPLLTQTLGDRYRMLERIGAGAMGAVYRARDLELDRDVAVKVLQPLLFDVKTAGQRLQREAEVLASLRHPGIVAVHDRGSTTSGLMYVVMDLVPGTSLATIAAAAATVGGGSPVPAAFADDSWLARHVPMPTERTWLRQVVRWTAELGDALDAAHRAGVCHRDVKPSNVLVQPDGRAVLVDFGIAARAADASVTATGSHVGTPCYMAPEAVGGTEPRPSLDIWSLGATLFHLLTGQPPFAGDTPSVLARLATDLPPSPRSLHPGLPLDLAAVVEHALQPDPAHRYPTAAAFAADLGAFLEHRPVAARPTSRFARRLRQVRRAPARALARLALVLILSLAGLGVVVVRQARAHDRRDRAATMAAKMRTIPALLALEGDSEQRLLEELDERGAAIAHLDTILALGDDLAVRLLRAALLLDQGEHARAADDLRHIEAQHDSPYLQAVAARYRAADSSRRGVQAVQLGGLPAPVTAVDQFVAGFHALRRREPNAAATADALLADAAATFPPARDLRLLSRLMLAERARGDERRALAQAVHDDALVLVGNHGKTARTQHVLGAACILLGRYDDAIVPLEEAIALRPGRHGPHQNLGIALQRVGRLEEAEQHFAEAARLRPWLWNTLYHQSTLLTELGQYDRAVECALAMPDTPGIQQAWLRFYACGHAELRRAEAALRVGDRTSAGSAATRAAAHYTAAAAAGGNAARMQRLRAYAAALVEERFVTAVALFAREAARDPLNPVQIVNLATLLRDETLGAEGLAALRAFLSAQAVALSPGRAEFAEFAAREARGARSSAESPPARPEAQPVVTPASGDPQVGRR
ncbi:MAG: serine/threonine-protein kinase [Planctomycetota bacterium]